MVSVTESMQGCLSVAFQPFPKLMIKLLISWLNSRRGWWNQRHWWTKASFHQLPARRNPTEPQLRKPWGNALKRFYRNSWTLWSSDWRHLVITWDVGWRSWRFQLVSQNISLTQRKATQPNMQIPWNSLGQHLLHYVRWLKTKKSVWRIPGTTTTCFVLIGLKRPHYLYNRCCVVCVFNPRQHRTWLALRYNLADLQAQLIPSSDHTISQNPGKWSFSYAMATVAKSLSLTVIIFMMFHDHLSFHSPVVVFFMCATDISQD